MKFRDFILMFGGFALGFLFFAIIDMRLVKVWYANSDLTHYEICK